MAESVGLLWTSPAAESALIVQNFKATRGEAISATFARQDSSSRVITGATITVRFATSQSVRTSLKVTATVAGTSFTAALTATDSASLVARRWFFQAFDETENELLSWGWMTLLDNTDLLDSGGIPVIIGTGGGDAFQSQTLDQFASVTQAAGKTFAITDNAVLSGTNTGDQTNISGNAATVAVIDAGADTTCWFLFANQQTGNQSPATNANATFNAATGAVALGGNLTVGTSGAPKTLQLDDTLFLKSAGNNRGFFGNSGAWESNADANLAIAAYTPTLKLYANSTTAGIVLSSTGAALTGVPTAPTAAPGTNTTQIATLAFVLANSGSGPIIDDGDSGTSKTIDFSAGKNHKVRLTGNCTFTFTAPAAGSNVLLECTTDGTSGRTRIWPGSAVWIGGTAPATLNTGETQLVAGFYDGTNYYLDATPSANTTYTNADMTGPISSTGNVTSITAQTGTGTIFVMSVAPTITALRVIGASGAGNVRLGNLTDASSFGGISFGAALTSTDFGLASNGTLTLLNTPTGGQVIVQIGQVNKAIFSSDGSLVMDASAPAVKLALYKNGNSITGFGFNASDFRMWHFTTGRIVFGHLSTSDGATFTDDVVIDANGKTTLKATSTAAASFNLPTGSAPTSPVNGDFWREDETNTGIKARINSVTKTVLAAGLSYLGNASKFVRLNAGETDLEFATPAGSGTVTNTGGNLTSNAIVLGAGTTDTKVVAGIITDGTSVISLGVNTTTIGKLKLFGNTSGDATIQPAAVAGTATVLTLPAVTGALATLAGTESFSGKTLVSPTITTSPTAAGATWTDLGTVTTADINGGTLDGTVIGGASAAAGTFTTLVAGSTTSLLLGTAGSAVGNIGFRNATSGTATLAPPTGALGTYTVTIPNAASTLPIFGQQITFAGPTAARTYTLVDANGTIADIASAQTFTTKTMIATTNVVEEITNTASSATPTPTGGSLRNLFTLTALAANAVFAAPSGSPAHGNRLLIIIVPDATPRTLGFNAIYRWIGQTAPTTTVASKIMMLAGVYDSGSSKWLMSGLAQEA